MYCIHYVIYTLCNVYQGYQCYQSTAPSNVHYGWHCCIQRTSWIRLTAHTPNAYTHARMGYTRVMWSRVRCEGAVPHSGRELGIDKL